MLDASCRASYDKGAQIEDPVHVQALTDEKHTASPAVADRPPGANSSRQSDPFLLARAADRGANLGAITAALLRVCSNVADAAARQAAILEAVERDVPHPGTVLRAGAPSPTARRRPAPSS